MCFGLVKNCQIPVTLKYLKVMANKINKFIFCVFPLFNLFPESLKYLSGLVAEKLYQNVIFIFKIKIDGAVSYTCFFRNL